MLGEYVSHIHPDQAMHGRQWDAAPDLCFTWINSSAALTAQFWDSSATAMPMLIPHMASQPFPRLVILPPCSRQLAEKGMFPKQVRVWPSIPRREGLKQEESKHQALQGCSRQARKGRGPAKPMESREEGGNKLGTASPGVEEATQGRREQRRPGQGRAAAGRDSQEIKGRVQDTLEQAPC